MRSAIFLVIVLTIFSTSLASANSLGITVWMPAEYDVGCSSHGFDQVIFTSAAGRLDLGENLKLDIVSTGTNTPPAWTSLSLNLAFTRDAYLYCHGSSAGSLFLEEYLDGTHATDAYDAYVAAYGGSNITISTSGVRVGLRAAGIESQLKPSVDSDGNQLVFACYSWTAKSSWGDYSSYNSGGSFFGYPSTVGTNTACVDLDVMSEIMACEDYASTGIENDIFSAYSETSQEGLFSGNQGNSLNPAVSCKSWNMELAAVEAWNGKLRFVVKNEERWSQYLIEGVDRIGDQPEGLVVKNGYGSDGQGVYRSYEVEAPQYRFLRVVAYDNSCLTTVSDWVRWEEQPDLKWAIEPGDELSLLPLRMISDGSFSDGRIVEPAAATKVFDIEPADVVVYTTEGVAPYASRIRGSWQVTPDSEGRFHRARVWSGSDDPEDVRTLYTQVWQANQDYNAANPEDPYRSRPILQIVGDGVRRIVEEDTVRVGPDFFKWSEGENGGSGDGIFRSYALMTDINGDDVPDGPVVVIPLKDYTEAQIHADAVESYNQAPSNSGVMVALDDFYGDAAAEWMEDGAFGEFGSYVSARGLNMKGMLKESDWLPSDDEQVEEQMAAAGAAIINSGVGEVWYTGLAAAYTRHTWFLEGFSDWTLDQGFLLFGPSCNFGGCDWPFGPEAIKDEMFGNPYGSVVVGGIGQLSAGYAHAHMKLANLMQEMLSQMPAGTLVVDAAFEIQQEFLSRFPDLREYGLGIHCVGSVAKLNSSTASAVGDDPLATAFGFGLRAFGAGSGAGIRFSLPQRSEVNLEVYDLRGARVAEIVRGDMLGEGEHSMIWNGRSNGRPVASGTYFARLRVGGENAATVKFAVVK